MKDVEDYNRLTGQNIKVLRTEEYQYPKKRKIDRILDFIFHGLISS